MLSPFLVEATKRRAQWYVQFYDEDADEDAPCAASSRCFFSCSMICLLQLHMG